MFINRQIGLDNLTSLVQDKGPLTLLRWSRKRKSEDKFFSSSKSQKYFKLETKIQYVYIWHHLSSERRRHQQGDIEK